MNEYASESVNDSANGSGGHDDGEKQNDVLSASESVYANAYVAVGR